MFVMSLYCSKFMRQVLEVTILNQTAIAAATEAAATEPSPPHSPIVLKMEITLFIVSC